MSYSILQNAHAVLLPAFDSLHLFDVMVPFLREGGQSVLIGESRAEYLARHMSEERLSDETPDKFRDCINSLRNHCPQLIVAVDEELAGIQRLQGLVPPLPGLSEARSMATEDLSQACYEAAAAARSLGVTMFLAPIADVVNGTNPWLAGRTLGSDPAEVAGIVAAYIEGVQRAGIVATTKHFPGFNELKLDPAITDVSMTSTYEEVIANAGPFRAAIGAGTKAVMVGPAPVAAIDGEFAACTSRPVISLLKNGFGFQGLIVSDDLDAPATMRDRTLVETAVASLNAGADLLLVAGGPTLVELSNGIALAVRNGSLSQERLAEAASKVRKIASTA